MVGSPSLSGLLWPWWWDLRTRFPCVVSGLHGWVCLAAVGRNLSQEGMLGWRCFLVVVVVVVVVAGLVRRCCTNSPTGYGLAVLEAVGPVPRHYHHHYC